MLLKAVEFLRPHPEVKTEMQKIASQYKDIEEVTMKNHICRIDGFLGLLNSDAGQILILPLMSYL